MLVPGIVQLPSEQIAVGLVIGSGPCPEITAQGPSPPLPQGASWPGSDAGLSSRGRCALNEGNQSHRLISRGKINTALLDV